MKPLKEIQDEVKTRVIGQDNAVDVVTSSIYKYLIKLHARDIGCYFKHASSLLLTGDSGSGKTHIVQEVADLLELPFFEINGKSIVQEGWSGMSFKELLEIQIKNLENKHRGHYFRGGIIFIDEFDKIITAQSASSSDNINLHIQASLLKYIEGGELVLKDRIIQMDKCLFILAGAFVGLKQDTKKENVGFINTSDNTDFNLTKALINYGMLPELAGRIQEHCTLNQLTKQNFYDILKSQKSIFSTWATIFKKFDLEFIVNEHNIVDYAVEQKLGARGLIQAIEKEATDLINNNKDNIDLDKFSVLYTPKI